MKKTKKNKAAKQKTMLGGAAKSLKKLGKGTSRRIGRLSTTQKVVGGASSTEVMQLVLVTQYFDTLKSIGENDRTNTLFLQHSPTAVHDVSEQILNAMLVSGRANPFPGAEQPVSGLP